MTLAPITIPCPTCGSTSDVVYSCAPSCCFNHVCGKCYTSFEPQTELAGHFSAEIGALPPEPDATAPTAPCARCGEWKLFAVVNDPSLQGLWLCISCKALLKLGVHKVEPA